MANTLLCGAQGGDLGLFFERLRANRVESRSIARKLSALRGLYRWMLLDGLSESDPTLHIETPASWKVLPKSFAEGEVSGGAGAGRGGRAGGGCQRNRGAGSRDPGAVVRGRPASGGALRAASRGSTTGRGPGAGAGQGRQGTRRAVRTPGMRRGERYLASGRPALLSERRSRVVVSIQSARSPGELFLSARGRPLTRQWVWQMVRQQHHGMSPHSLRHSCATHMGSRGRTCAPCRRCWDTRISQPPRCTRMWRCGG